MVLPSIRPAVQDLDYRPGQLAIGRCQVRALWSEMRLTSRQVNAGRFVTHHFALADFIEAYDVFARAAETGALKVVLNR